MPELIIWKTEEMNRLRRDMGRMFSRVWEDFGMPPIPSAAVSPTSIEMLEEKDHITIRAKIPGVDPDGLRIDASERQITLRGSIKDESIKEDNNIRTTETRFGSFSRTFRLPSRIRPEDTKATFDSGILEIILPKAALETRQIDIQFK